MLSFFLQMCSPIQLSALDGGHRTWAITCFMTGIGFNADGNFTGFGSLFNPHKKKINPLCTMLASFDTHLVFNEMTFDDDLFGKNDCAKAREASQIIKNNEETLNRTTRVGFLFSSLSDLRDGGFCLGSSRTLFFDPYQMQVEKGKRKGAVKIRSGLETKLHSLMAESYKLLTTREPYKTLLKNQQKPSDIFGKEEKKKPFDILLKALNFKFCNQSPNKSKLLHKLKPPSPLQCAIYSLTFCAMFSDVVEEILATLQSGLLEQDLYHLEDFVFFNMCLPAFAIGGLFRFLVPQDSKWNAAKEVINFGDKKAFKLGSEEKQMTYLSFKEIMLPLLAGSRFLAE